MNGELSISKPMDSVSQAPHAAGADNLDQFRSGNLKFDLLPNTSAESHLPSVLLPVSMDKSVMQEHDKLTAMADKQLPPGEARQQFKDNISKFEERADQDGLSPTQVADTYKQMERMLGQAPDSPLTSSQRQELAGQWIERLADPTGEVRQGWHDTCGFTVLEMKLLSKDPDKITGKMAELITTGGVTTYDMEQAQQLVDIGKNVDVMPTHVMQIDEQSLQPDQEAQGLSPHSDRRDYVDQIAQVMEINMKWDAQIYAPNGDQVLAGSISYNQCTNIARPSDAQPGGKAQDMSCESVSYEDPTKHNRVVVDDSGFGFGGQSSSIDLNLVDNIITGRSDTITLQRPVQGMKIDTDTAFQINSPEELKTQLTKMQEAGQFPVPISLDVNNPIIRDDYLARHPERPADKVPEGWHSTAVTGIDSQGNVQLYNPWGEKHTMTPAQLYEIMGKNH